MDDPIRKFTVKQYAEREQVTPRTVWRWVQKGAVEVYHTPSGRVRIVEPSSSVVVFSTSPTLT